MDHDLVLALAVLGAAGIYAFLDGRQATLLAMIGGWAFLPTGEYPASVIELGKEISGPTHAIALSSTPWFNKATALGFGCLLGTLLFQRVALMKYQTRWIDLAAAIWIIAPIPSYLANGLPFAEALATSLSLAMGWGVPYVLGSIFFAESEGMIAFARAWVIVGIAVLPYAFVEFVSGPFWYEIVYGGHPYRFDGSTRALGHRPLVFLEHGNQFGMWATTAAIAAAGLWIIGERGRWQPRHWQVPLGPVAIILVASCVLWQSHGAVGILIASLLILWALKWPWRLRRIAFAGTLLLSAAVVFCVLFALATRLAWVHDHLRSAFHGIGKSSFTWRLARIVENLPQMIQHPLLGWGRADWSHKSADGTFVDPIALSLWFHALGRFGVFGLTAMGCLLVVPVLGKLVPSLWSRRVNAACPASLVAILLAANVADLAMNSGLILPLMLGVGGLSCQKNPVLNPSSRAFS